MFWIHYCIFKITYSKLINNIHKIYWKRQNAIKASCIAIYLIKFENYSIFMNFLPQPIPGCASFLSSLLHQLRTSKFYPSKQQVIDGPFTKLLLTCHFDQSDPLSVFPAHQRPLTSSSILTGGFINYVVTFFNLSNLVLVLL